MGRAGRTRLTFCRIVFQKLKLVSSEREFSMFISLAVKNFVFVYCAVDWRFFVVVRNLGFEGMYSGPTGQN